MFAGKGISNNIPQLTVRLVVRQIPLDNVRNSFSRVCNTSQICFLFIRLLMFWQYLFYYDFVNYYRKTLKQTLQCYDGTIRRTSVIVEPED